MEIRHHTTYLVTYPIPVTQWVAKKLSDYFTFVIYKNKLNINQVNYPEGRVCQPN